ncbi:MAG: hypothetical protein MJ236_03260 [Clostridia bacterium]|nr:hypothetical protein [Clostridia bacterium]
MKNTLIVQNLSNGIIPTNPQGESVNDISLADFDKSFEQYVNLVFEMSKIDVSTTIGYGEFWGNENAPYGSFKEFLIETFNPNNEGYWKNWHKLFETSFIKREYFEKIFNLALKYSDYCEGNRYLVNNSTFFCNMTSDGNRIYCTDWSRIGIMDYFMDFAIMDLHKPFFFVPEKLYEYTKNKGINIPNFKERFLCMAYFKGIDTLRWHASINDIISCESITRSINDLDRRMSLL